MRATLIPNWATSMRITALRARRADLVKERFGVQGVVDLAGTVGHYAFMTQVINALDVGLPPGTTPELPA